MEKLKRARTPLRMSFTRTGNLIEDHLHKEDPDKHQLNKSLEKLERIGAQLNELDGKILESLLEDEVAEDDYAAEHESIEHYQDQLLSLRYDVVQFLESQNPGLKHATSLGNISSQSLSSSSKRKVKLPKLELTKFSGEVKEWLGFWSQFKNIHEDDDLAMEDKFQYLIQATVKESRAREIVDSFPATADNYPKVIQSLQNRFGREDLLVEVYVRELLKLVIQNVSQTQEQGGMTRLYDSLESYLRALESIGVTSDKYTAILFPLVESCLPEEVLRAWQRSGIPQTSPASSPAKGRLQALMGFLLAEVEGEERISLAREGFGQDSQPAKQKKRKGSEPGGNDVKPSTAAGLLTVEKSYDKKRTACIFCDKQHESRECFQAQKMSMADKRATITARRCCFICLKPGHTAKMCKAGVRCLVCGRRHSALMCPDLPSHKEVTNVPATAPKETAGVVLANSARSSKVILQTLEVYLKGPHKQKLARLIFDSGSHRSYIMRSTAEEMGYEILGEEGISHTLFGGVQPASQRHRRYRVIIGSISGDFCCNFEALDQETICGEISRIQQGPILQELLNEGVQLTDVGPTCKTIEILIGGDILGKLLTGSIKDLKSGMTAIETKLGWTVMGKLPVGNSTCCLSQCVTSMFISNSMVTDLWSLDTIGIHDAIEVQSRREIDQVVKDHFLQTVKQSEDGRYEVHLPWIVGHPFLPDNKRIAQQRLMSTTHKLEAMKRVDDYHAIFQDWLKQGIIEVVPEDDVAKVGHYLPHRAVIREKSATTPVRPVFDASAKEKKAPSLNDCLEKGPNLLELLPAILMKFRIHRFGIVADISKAFLQISLRKEDRDYLRFLWWETGATRRIVELRHCRVVFGVNCSPFLLGAVINHHLERVTGPMQATARKLAKSFYVDNCVTSLPDKEEVDTFMNQAKVLMSNAGFKLTGWEHSLDPKRSITSKPVLVLGMVWDQREDTLQCDLSDFKATEGDIVTKREVLSAAHRVFDPIGFTTPVTLRPKMLLQGSWALKVGWDAALPNEIARPFISWREELAQLAKIKIPRWVLQQDSASGTWSLHTFCDASKGAYAAVVYLRALSNEGVTIQLVQAKARVAPLKKATIPRLELLACCIGSRLAATVKESLERPDVPSYFWTDSTTALHWIQCNDQWGVFVSNRVQEINRLTVNDKWRHLPGDQNPADLPSRGCSVKQLQASKWWEGPAWLKLPEKNWPSTCELEDEAEIMAERKRAISSTLFVQSKANQWYLQYFSTYESIVRMIGWIKRFGFNALHTANKKSGKLTVDEITAAETQLLLVVQKEAFHGCEDPALRSLRVYLDEQGLYRVKTRIVFRVDAEDFRSPIIIPGEHPLVTLMIRSFHLRNCHAGLHFLLSIIRERFWIVRARQVIRRVIARCIPCKKLQGKPYEAVSAPLPPERIKDAAAFEIVGVDLAGPLFPKDDGKAWIVLFTCAVYRAVHLELVHSLSTEAFMRALRRFVARRGRPSLIYSDNGTNFVGTSNVLRQVDWEEIQKQSSVQRIQWKFNPPTAAWWGGWWERLIGMLKQLMKRVLGRASVSCDEITTILCECEATMNARPLTYVSNNVDDLIPLTPAMFIQDIQQSGVPDFDVVDAGFLRKRARYRNKLKKDLQQRFRKEYLGQLIQGKDARKTHGDIGVGDLVLVGADNIRRINWPLAKVITVYPGKDGAIRLAELRTARGVIKRPVQRLIPLEVTAEERDALKPLPETPDHRGPEEAKPILETPDHRGPEEAKPILEIPDHHEPVEAIPVFNRRGRRIKAKEKLNL